MTLRRILGNLAKSLDSSAIGSYLSKGASETDFRAILYSEISGTPSVVADSAVATAIVDSAYVQARQGSTTGLTNIDSAASLAILDSDYMQSRITAGGVGFKVYHFETTNGQTTFQDSDADGDVLGYTENGILVFKNGVLLLDSSDYTASDGTSVVLTSGTDSGELVSIAKWSLGGGGAGVTWYGDRAVVMGGYDNSTPQNVIDYFDMTTPGNASDFGDLVAASNMPHGAEGDGTTVVKMGGSNSDWSGYINSIDYITVASPGNATDFGDLNNAGGRGVSTGDGIYALCTSAIDVSGSNSINLDYVTIATPSNASDFGDLTEIAWRSPAGFNDATYGCIAGGNRTSTKSSTIDYVTVQSPGNATDFGDLTTGSYDGGGTSDTTYGLAMGGDRANGNNNTIDYVTIATPGNASDFGDMTIYTTYHSCSSNATYATTNGGANVINTIQYVTIATPGNASDFGDLSVARKSSAGSSGSPS